MKRLFVTLWILSVLFAAVGCSRISIQTDEPAVLQFSGKWKDDHTELTQMLTDEETSRVSAYLTAARYSPGEAGCPFDEDISITFGDQVFAISYDDCPTVWLVGSEEYYMMSDEGRDYIVSLFEKYVGYFPFPPAE